MNEDLSQIILLVLLIISELLPFLQTEHVRDYNGILHSFMLILKAIVEQRHLEDILIEDKCTVTTPLPKEQ